MYKATVQGRRYSIRDDMLESLEDYINYGLPTGDFLTAILQNDFVGALGHADTNNSENIQAYASFLYNKAPALCWGSKRKVKDWRKRDFPEKPQKRKTHYD